MNSNYHINREGIEKSKVHRGSRPTGDPPGKRALDDRLEVERRIQKPVQRLIAEGGLASSMSLRDYFAGQALAAYIPGISAGYYTPGHAVCKAVDRADELVAELRKGPSE